MAGKVYVVEDADPEASSGIPAGTFPGTLAGLHDALDAARYPELRLCPLTAMSSGAAVILLVTGASLDAAWGELAR